MTAPFRRYVCWDGPRAATVLNTEALDPPRDVFLATHYPLVLYRSDRSDVQVTREYEEQQLHDDLLATADFALVAVLGGAGTGKSHLVRWLETTIPETESRRVILIPRAGTSLYEVVKRILRGLEGSRFENYRRRLAEGSLGLTVPAAAKRLLQSLEANLRGSVGKNAGPAAERDDYLCEELPKLLGDVVLGEYFLLSGGVLERLAQRITGVEEIDRAEGRREFSRGDLPQDPRDLKRASEPAQQIFADLLAPSMADAAIDLLNRHLDRAIAEVMRLGATDLAQLMLEVRMELARQGVELVLLIEDLATLQGLDLPLLEALIVRTHQAGMERLCALRTVAAMTTGYYAKLPKTIQQRFDFVIAMDRGDSDFRGHVSEDDVQRFVARYLNATRLTPEAIEAWYQSPTDPRLPPSACAQCRHKEPCHDAFGAVDGVGLYPFSKQAIERINAIVNPEGFNPRLVLKTGLRPVLETYGSDIRQGEFPSSALLQHFGKTRLDNTTRVAIERADPNDAGRRIALLDIWSTTVSPINLHSGIHEAFSLPPIPRWPSVEGGGPGSGQVERKTPPDGPSVPDSPNPLTPATPPANEMLERKLTTLNEWTQGGAIDQALTNDLRALVFNAIVGHVNWDMNGLVRGEFVGQSKAFRKPSINFRNQTTQQAPVQVVVTLPHANADSGEMLDTALALEGLLKRREHGSWSFEGGGKLYRIYLQQVDKWGLEVLRQLKAVSNEQATWDPLPCVVGLLALGARVTGRSITRSPTASELLSACLQKTAPPTVDRSTEWAQLATELERRHEKLRDIVLAFGTCSKGASTLDIQQVVDAGRVLTVLKRVSEEWRAQESPPVGLQRSFAVVTEYHNLLASGLEGAVETELQRLTEGVDRFADAFGDEVLQDNNTLRNAVRDTMEMVRKGLEAAGRVALRRDAGLDLVAATNALTEPSVSASILWIQEAARQPTTGAKLEAISAVPTIAWAVANAALAGVGRALQHSANALETEMTRLRSQGGAGVEVDQQQMADDLDVLSALLASVKES